MNINLLIMIFNKLIDNNILNSKDIINLALTNTNVFNYINWEYAIITLKNNFDLNIFNKIIKLYNNKLFNIYFEMHMLYKYYDSFFFGSTFINEDRINKLLIKFIIISIDKECINSFEHINHFQNFHDKFIYYGGNLKIIDNNLIDYYFYYGMTLCVIIPKTVEIIGDYTFNHMNIIQVIIPNSVLKIGKYAFYNNILSNVIIPNSVLEIGECAFNNNDLLSNVIIPKSVLKIGKNAFSCDLLFNNNN